MNAMNAVEMNNTPVNAINLQVVTRTDILKCNEMEFAEVGRQSLKTVDMGEGQFEAYLKIELAGHLHAVIYDDVDVISFEYGDKVLARLELNEETKVLLHDFDDTSMIEVMSLLAEYGVSDL